MSYSGIRTVDVDPEIAKLLASLDSRIEEYNKTFFIEVDNINKKEREIIQNKIREIIRKISINKLLDKEKSKSLSCGVIYKS